MNIFNFIYSTAVFIQSTYSFAYNMYRKDSSPNTYTQSDLPGGKPCVFHASCFVASALGNSGQ